MKNYDKIKQEALAEMEREIEAAVKKATDRLKRNFPAKPQIQTAKIFDRDVLIRTIDSVSLAEYMHIYKLEPGQQIFLTKFEDGEYVPSRDFWVGDATPYHEPSTNDGGFGWSYESDICKEYVSEVHIY